MVRDWLAQIASIDVKLFQMTGAADECCDIHEGIDARSER